MDARNKPGNLTEAAASVDTSSSMPSADVMQIDSIQQKLVDPIDPACSSLVALPDELKYMIDAHLPFSAKANLAQTCHAYHSFFNQALVKTINPDYQANHTKPKYTLTYQPYIRFHRELLQKFLNHVIYGEQDAAETMLQRDPGLLLAVGTVKDYSRRKIEGTALQMALGAEDVKCHEYDNDGMVEMIHNYLRPLPNGEAIIAEQTLKQFPPGWEQKEAKREASDYAALKQVFETIAMPAGSNDHEQRQAIELAIQTFKKYLADENSPEKIIQTGKHFNHQLLAEAFNKFVRCYVVFGGLNSDRNRIAWRQVIGSIERYVPAATAQALCTGAGRIVDGKIKLNRSLELHIEHSNTNTSYFPLDNSPSYILGRDFAVYGCNSPGRACAGVRADAVTASEIGRILHQLCRIKHQTCSAYAAVHATVTAPVARP